MTTCVKHDFSVLRAAILLKFSFLSFKYVLLVFTSFFFHMKGTSVVQQLLLDSFRYFYHIFS